MRISTILVLLIISGDSAEPQDQAFHCRRGKGQIDDPDGRSTETCCGSGTPATTLPR